MYLLDFHQETKPKKRVFAMAGLSFFKYHEESLQHAGSHFVVLRAARESCTGRQSPTDKDENGWKLQVNGEDYYIRVSSGAIRHAARTTRITCSASPTIRSGRFLTTISA